MLREFHDDGTFVGQVGVKIRCWQLEVGEGSLEMPHESAFS